MESINPSFEKYRPRPRKIGEPRSQREELIEQFRARLNEEQDRDHRPHFSYAHLARWFKGISDTGLYELWRDCNATGVRSFGAMLTWKLKQIA